MNKTQQKSQNYQNQMVDEIETVCKWGLKAHDFSRCKKLRDKISDAIMEATFQGFYISDIKVERKTHTKTDTGKIPPIDEISIMFACDEPQLKPKR